MSKKNTADKDYDSQSILTTSTSIDDDGRFNLDVRRRNRGFANIFSSSHQNFSFNNGLSYIPLLEETSSTSSLPHEPVCPPPPPLNIVIQIVGSRGDVQPFVALGCTLKEFGHRVRIATHAVFKNFVEGYGLEFFNIGGNPQELMAFMVKNPGLFPSYDALRSGDVKRQRENMSEILEGCWKSCIEMGDGISPYESWEDANSSSGHPGPKPFVADAIIANPPSFAYIHCAEKLGVPLHLMFTMPYSPTEAFPHPLVNIKRSELGKGLTNRLSYAIIERLTWHGLGDIINKFREGTLGLEPLNIMLAAGMITRLKIPYTYCWSPYLLPKPRDWGSHISISGFYFLPFEANFKPSSDLVKFLDDGEPPIYIGFGSIVVDNPQAMTSMVLEAIELAGTRALISKGWSDIGKGGIELPKTVCLIENVPHSWLFQHVSVVVHHGGAGTTAAGLHAGKPTVVVPFFGDQLFWGEMVSSAGAGPRPLRYAKQTAQTLAQQIRDALQPEVKIRARHLGLKLEREQGCQKGMEFFHRSLNYDDSRCSILYDRLAIWQVKGTQIRLGVVAAAILIEHGHLRLHELDIIRHQEEYLIESQPIDPISGGASAFLGSFGDIMYQTYDLPRQIIKAATKKSSRYNSSSTTIPQPQPPENDNGNGIYHNSLATNPTRHSSGENLGKLPEPAYEKSQEIVLAAFRGIGKLSKAILSTPLYFTMGITRGFQSIPIAYCDTTVRKPDRVEGIQSGLEVAVSQFVYGFYDGISGVVTQPLDGAKENGALGLVTGIGKGIGGLILKPGAGIFALSAYPLQGISQEIRKAFGPHYERQVAYSRLAQGRGEMKTYSSEEQQGIILAWRKLQEESSR